MANNEDKEAIRLTPEGEVQCFRDLRSQVIKLLYMIEAESRGEQDISLWFYGFVYELASSNVLCGGKLTKVLVKIHGLYDGDNYKTMTHAQIKRQIMECRGIVDGLIAASLKQTAGRGSSREEENKA